MKRFNVFVVLVLIAILTLTSTAAYASTGTEGEEAPSAAAPMGTLADNVQFVDFWAGACTIQGTLGGSTKAVSAGAFNMTVNGQTGIQGYCIDMDHNISKGNSWEATVADAPGDLCAVTWILANYSTDEGNGLSEKEMGVAIQGAIWYFEAGSKSFVPERGDSAKWCGKDAVYNRAWEIINAAEARDAGDCGSFAESLVLDGDTSTPSILDVIATVTDQDGNPFAGQTVNFSVTPAGHGMNPSQADTDAVGEAYSAVDPYLGGSIQVQASMSFNAFPWTLDDVLENKQRIIVVPPETASDTWDYDPNPTAVELAAFGATAEGNSVEVRWETASEVDVLGFNLYRAEAVDGARTKLTDALIASQAPGSVSGAAYSFVDDATSANTTYFYWLESVDVSGETTIQGPVSAATAPLARLSLARPRFGPRLQFLSAR